MPGRQILDAIGDTPLVRLQRAAPPGAATTVAKLESANPTGSMKDRMARAAIETAAADDGDPDKVDEIIQVSTAEGQAMTRRLAREEAIFAGASSGANVAAAVKVAQRLGPDAVVATIIVDSGMRYISTDLFR